MRNKARRPLSPRPLSTALDGPARPVGQERPMKGARVGSEEVNLVTDNMVVYVENFKSSTKEKTNHLLELWSECVSLNPHVEVLTPKAMV